MCASKEMVYFVLHIVDSVGIYCISSLSRTLASFSVWWKIGHIVLAFLMSF